MSKATPPDGGEVFSTYWPTGELKRAWGSRTYPVEYTYDDQGRMKTLTTWQDFAGDSGRAVTTWNYEPATGWLQQKLYDDGKGPSYSYSPAGRLLTRTWARKVNGQDLVTSYAYTTAGDLETVDYSNTPGPLKDVVYGYDRRGRQTSITDSTGTRVTTFTAAGQPDTVAWQDGVLAGMALDYTQDNLLRQSGYTLTHDAQPQPETITAVSYGYDRAGRLYSVTAGTDVFTYSYLPNSGLVDTVTARHGATEIMKTVKNWDNLNRLTSIENRNGADVPARVYSSHAYTYNNANQRTEAVREDVTKWAYGYDALGQVTSGVKKKQDGTPLPGLSFGYLFDDIGNRREATTDVGGALRAATYSANLLNQYSQRTVPGFIDLLGEAAPDATVTVNNQPTVRDGALFFKSLAVNNAASAVSQDVHVVGVKNDVGPLGEDAVTEVQGKRFVPQTPEGFTYDDDGNLQSDGRWSYEWDAENRLVAMETLPGLPASVTKLRLEFLYDSQSRRVSKKVFAWDAPTSSFIPHNSSLFLYDGWNLIAELSVLPVLSVRNVFLWGLDLSGSLQGAGGVGGLLASSSAGATQYFSFDGNGNVVVLVDSSNGTATARYEYDPFGNVVLQAGSAAAKNAFRFSTKCQDDETGLVYYGYRYYAPGIGRWVSRDPVFEDGGVNLHLFGRNNAYSGYELLGMAWKVAWRASDLPYAHVVRDDASDSIETLAGLLHLVTDEAFGENGWLRKRTGRVVDETALTREDFDNPDNCNFAVPNIVVVRHKHDLAAPQTAKVGQHFMDLKHKVMDSLPEQKKYWVLGVIFVGHFNGGVYNYAFPDNNGLQFSGQTLQAAIGHRVAFFGGIGCKSEGGHWDVAVTPPHGGGAVWVTNYMLDFLVLSRNGLEQLKSQDTIDHDAGSIGTAGVKFVDWMSGRAENHP